MERRIVLLMVTVALAACGKVEEKLGEKAAEKMIESAMSKDGTQAKVDLSSGTVKLSTTDDKGNTTTTELGGAKVTEADVGVAFYPGATQDPQQSSRVSDKDSKMVMTRLSTPDSVDKVAAFYRGKFQAMAQGKTLSESSDGNESALFILHDNKTDQHITVQIEKQDQGSAINLMGASK